MDQLKLAIVIYLSGIVFNLAVIAYLNERKEMKIPKELAIISWFGPITSICVAVCRIGEIVLRFVYYCFCEIFRKRI